MFSLILSLFDTICTTSVKLIYLSCIILITINLLRRFRKKILISSHGKAVLITGCDTGFGHLLALSLNERGFRIFATVYDPNSDGAKKLATSCRFPDQMVVIKMDVTDDNDVRQAYSAVSSDLQEHKCSLWAVVNNAGYMLSSLVEWGQLQTYERIFQVNVFGVVRVTRIFLPLIKQSKGRVVNVSSVLGLFVMSNLSAYCMTKASVIRFSDTLRKEMARFGVRVATIMPGGFSSTGLFAGILSLVDKTWAETDDTVKSSYGQKYFDDWKKGMQKGLDSDINGNNSYIVVNDMVDAVMDVEPRNNYQPIQGTSLTVPLALIGGHYWLQTHRRRQRSPTDGPVFGFRSAALFGYDDKDSPPRTDSIHDTCKQAFSSVVGVEPLPKPSSTTGKQQPRKQSDEKCRSSGFIVKDESILNGYVITTARATAQTRDVNIICTDGQRRTGKVVYMEAHLDLALIEVTATGSPLSSATDDAAMAAPNGIELVDSDELKNGQQVVAVSSESGHHTISAGVINTTKRLGKDIPRLREPLDPNTHYIQHTALFATERCGGALLEGTGKLAGIYSYVRPDTQFKLFYAIPSNVIREFMTRGKQYLDLMSKLKANPKFLDNYLEKSK
ncbi:unnamed protein product [Medioppia subpectinata]|uniref:Estradiol 17-beta-dehydrogenase 2 n=1 Tax=Medioppia subpectinata TaxID=1979941 RepID=A0A7R9KKP0_9ACAR|nr:unnamed protein product [Medioppia subpectinata]CAG2104111.1 unnamed protein product [Medioppia subpectinata]